MGRAKKASAFGVIFVVLLALGACNPTGNCIVTPTDVSDFENDTLAVSDTAFGKYECGGDVPSAP